MSEEQINMCQDCEHLRIEKTPYEYWGACGWTEEACCALDCDPDDCPLMKEDSCDSR